AGRGRSGVPADPVPDRGRG
ncbi:MAG: hypothetical protein AVDCRST_MAG79-75, partial [uncultured Thermoleophilia bacterium]